MSLDLTDGGHTIPVLTDGGHILTAEHPPKSYIAGPPSWSQDLRAPPALAPKGLRGTRIPRQCRHNLLLFQQAAGLPKAVPGKPRHPTSRCIRELDKEVCHYSRCVARRLTLNLPR